MCCLRLHNADRSSLQLLTRALSSQLDTEERLTRDSNVFTVTAIDIVPGVSGAQADWASYSCKRVDKDMCVCVCVCVCVSNTTAVIREQTLPSLARLGLASRRQVY